MSLPKNPLVRAFPHGLDTQRELVLADALESAADKEPELPDSDRAQLERVQDAKNKVMAAFENRNRLPFLPL